MRVLFASRKKQNAVSPTTELFREIDLNNDGRICKEDVKIFLHKLNVNKSYIDRLAEYFLHRCGVGPESSVSLEQFAHYVHEQDRRLSPVYAQIDRKMEGVLDLVDIQAYFLKLGIVIELSEAKQLLQRIDATGPEAIAYSQWRKFLIFQPICDPVSIAHYWRAGSLIDLSGDPSVSIPEILKKKRIVSSDLGPLLAGAVAGVISRTATAPIDRLKIMRQVHGWKHKQSGFVTAYKYMKNEGGIVSFWRGNLINVVKVAPETGIKYYTYERYKRFFLNNEHFAFLDGHPALTKFVSGAMAGLTAQTIIYPLEVVRTRMCLRKTGQYTSIVDCAGQIYKKLGIRGFFRGYMVNFAGVIPYAGIELATYETLKSLYIHRYMNRVLNLSPHVYPDRHVDLYVHPPAHTVPIIAMLSSMLGIICTYPMALIRSKMQASFFWSHTPLQVSGGPAMPQQAHPIVTVPSLLQAIWRDDGLLGFYRGLGTNLFKVIPASAISFFTYETIRQKFNLGPMGSG